MTQDMPAAPLAVGVRLAQARPDLSGRVSPAQLKVLELLLDGHTEPQIGEILGRSRHTVHDHTKAIYAALGVTSRVQLVLLFSAPR
jgi:DNA-binding NarL/FixJ family response regulator